MNAAANGLTLLLGGVRSGKSDLAVQIGCRFNGDVTFVATATPFDNDMATRIARHRLDRPAWPTIDSPTDIEAALISAPPNHLVIVDCLTVWLGNAMFENWTEPEILDAAHLATRAAVRRHGPTVVVTNEVGMGVHPETELGRSYRDLLGRVNRIWAHAAHRSLLIVAGRATPLHDPWEFL
jgi:adenosyl cobinamide kinase/adenosyl cobinamide phosphate guanylyltransferase